MPIVTAHKNETVDDLAYRIFGNSAAVEEIYRLNQNLARHGLRLPHGTEVNVPETTTAAVATAKRTSLWD